MSSTARRLRDLERQLDDREAKLVGLRRKAATVDDALAEREREVRAEYAGKQSQVGCFRR